MKDGARIRLRRLETQLPNDSAWSRVFALHLVGDAGADRASIATHPAVLAHYVIDGTVVRLTPRFPLTPGVTYEAVLDRPALARLADLGSPADSAPSRLRFVIPAPSLPRLTRVIDVYPSAESVPANLLRWYVELSAPMESGSALQHVRLLDASGREVEGAFLTVGEELWDPERRRLTLLFDPGRVKRGIRTNVEEGAPLIAGRRYRLTIDREWRDGRGAGLASGWQRWIEVTPADRTSPDPSRWHIAAPRGDTRDALRVSFAEPLDHALPTRMLTIVGGSGEPIAGRSEVANGDSAWTFVPEAVWHAGHFRLRVGAALEDLAGNSVARLFDADRHAGDRSVEDAEAEQATRGDAREVPFVVQRASIAGRCHVSPPNNLKSVATRLRDDDLQPAGKARAGAALRHQLHEFLRSPSGRGDRRTHQRRVAPQ